MFEVLLESRHVRPPRPVTATALSAAAHAALVLAFVGGTAAATRDELSPAWEEMTRRFLAPPEPRPVVGGERVAFFALREAGAPRGQNEGVAERARDDQVTGIPIVARKAIEPLEISGPMELAKAAERLGAFTMVSVDSVAERDPRSAAPEYPPQMLAQNIEGSAVFRFVIDSTGLVDLATVREISATRKEFADAVRAAMPRMRFRPAMRNLIYVRQLVEQPFAFRIVSAPPPPPGKVPA
jgi:protein TonB